MVRLTLGGLAALMAVGLGCDRLRLGGAEESSSETTTSARPSAPLAVEGPGPDVLATMSCYGKLQRQLPDGTVTHGLTETLVVRWDGTAAVHDVDPAGRVISGGLVAPEQLETLAAVVTSPEWASLPHKRGAPFPDGPACEIVASHRSVLRYDDPADEPEAKQAWSELHALWHQVDWW